MPFLLVMAAVLARFIHPKHRVNYAHGDEFTCCLPATPSRLGLLCESQSRQSTHYLRTLNGHSSCQ
ncbi:Uncharacterised protein [Vibrio cholerae]|nr:Uncharacterised protein [Vibrio cholerae]